MSFLLILGAELPIPTWGDITKGFGPYFGTLVFLLFIVLYLQHFWYRKNLESKDKEIDRSVKRVSELENKLLELIDEKRKKK